MTFFRKEVFENIDGAIGGKHINVFPTNNYYLVWTLVLFLMIALMVAQFIPYSEKITVKGMLIPQKGIVNIHPFSSGYVQNVHVINKQIVKKGQPLFSFTNNNTLGYKHYLEQTRKNHQNNIDRLQQNFNGLNEQFSQKVANLSNSERLLEDSIAEMNNKLKLQKEHVSMLQKVVDKLDTGEKQMFFSEFEILSRRTDLIIEKKSTSSIELQKLAILNELTKLNLERSETNAEQQSKQLQLQLQLHNEQKLLLELDNDHEQIMLSPADGVVSSLTLVAGGYLDSSNTVLRLLPLDTVMVARLALPMRAIGKVQLGESINIRFSAYPHYKFGKLKAKLIRVENSLMAAEEFAQELNFKSPFYLAEARLQQGGLLYHGKPLPLLAGMEIEADIIESNQSLFKWFFQYIFKTSEEV
jgi:membrane fusion protein